ncbi:MAG: zf-HC2 domain-containing protein [Longimicrobiales bacterium]|nr:zf-HC2 domain-containing protein [Longimicrobiales bacterium]
MDCTTFVEHFSSWVDDEIDPELRDRLNLHVARCPECRKYEEVYLAGARLLRSIDEEAEVDEELFRDSLQRRLLLAHRESRTALAVGSGVPIVPLVAIMVVLLSVAWVPVLASLSEPTVDLPPIAAVEPAARTPSAAASRVGVARGASGIRTVPLRLRSTVSPPQELMRRYAPVLQPYRRAAEGID